LKTYKTYLFVLIALAIFYIIIELNKPKVFDWSFTYRNNDDNPYGCSVLYKELKQVFAGANIYSHREPAFNVLHNNDEAASAYCIIAPEIVLGKNRPCGIASIRTCWQHGIYSFVRYKQKSFRYVGHKATTVL